MPFERWFIYALLSAVCASFVAIFGKVGMAEVDSNLATAIRSMVMTILLVIFCSMIGVWSKINSLHSRALWMIALSGVAGAASWLFYFKAIQVGTVSQVAPIDKLSMPLTVILATLLLGDRPTLMNWVGVGCIVLGGYLASLPRG